jgi:hypothetical protein
MRTDSLSFLLAMSNASAHHDVLVLETCGGLVSAAVAERLGGHGTVCSTYRGPRPDSIDLARMFNFDEATANCIVRAPLPTLVASRTSKEENVGVAERNEDGAAKEGNEGANATEGEKMVVDEEPGVSGKNEEEAIDGWRNLGVGRESENAESKGKESPVPEPSGEGPVEEGDGTGWRGLGVGEDGTGGGAGPSNRAAKAAERKARRDEKKKAEGGGNKVGRIGTAASEEQLQRWGKRGFTRWAAYLTLLSSVGISWLAAVCGLLGFLVSRKQRLLL